MVWDWCRFKRPMQARGSIGAGLVCAVISGATALAGVRPLLDDLAVKDGESNPAVVAEVGTDAAGTADRMTPELLWKLGRLGEAVVAPDSASVVYSVRRYELAENSGSSSLYWVDAKGETTKELLGGWKSLADLQWAGQGEDAKLYFTGVDPDNSEAGSQAYVWNAGMEKPRQLTDIADGIANLKVSPTQKHLAYTVRVKMDSTVNELYPDLPKADARIIDALMFRHWDSWHDYSYSHLHVAELPEAGLVVEGRDLMAGLRADCPVPPFGGASQYAWSPDGLELAYTTKIDANMAQSTNTDIYLIDVAGKQTPKNITLGQMGYDKDPVYSPDGQWIAYNSMARAGFEADRNRILLYDRRSQTTREVTTGLDQNADHGRWLPDSKRLVFDSDYRGSLQSFVISIGDGSVQRLSNGQANDSIMDVAPDGRHVLVSKNTMIYPAELYMRDISTGNEVALSDINGSVLAGLELPTVEERWVTATDGKSIHCWVIYPPGFDANSEKKYPMLTYCQGGPQGQISQFFSYRWNFHLMAANDYIILAPNRRGLPGFGREWNDQISGDWGGQAMKDLLSATDSMLEETYIDRARIGAVGASFGGYSVYWLMGNSGDRFASMIAHCGVFNLESMYASTEELFFVDWDLGGPYWTSPEIREKYERFSPNRFVNQWKVPLLVIHGEKDFRVPINQGLEAFTTAQLQGVPSKFLYFPEEGHWVMKPQNGVLWHRVFFEWLDEYLKP